MATPEENEARIIRLEQQMTQVISQGQQLQQDVTALQQQVSSLQTKGSEVLARLRKIVRVFVLGVEAQETDPDGPLDPTYVAICKEHGWDPTTGRVQDDPIEDPPGARVP